MSPRSPRENVPTGLLRSGAILRRKRRWRTVGVGVVVAALAWGLTLTVVDAQLASYRDEVLADSPISYWRLGEASGTAAADLIGANNGTYVGGVTLGVPGALSGDSNTAVTFDGTTGHVLVPDSASLDVTSGVTIELWVQRQKSGYQVLLGKPGNGQSKFEHFAIWISASNRPQAYFGDGTTYATAVGPVLDTAWHHIVATYDNASARLYVDGQLTSTGTSAVALTPNALPLNIGRSNDNQYFFGGSLDEVAIYGTVLSAGRIAAHFEASTNGGGGGDTTPPSVSLSSPASGATVSVATPTFSGVAGTAPGDSSSVTVEVFAGSTVSGSPVQSLVATRDASGAYSVEASSALANGTYTARASQSDDAGNVGVSTANTFTVNVPTQSSDPVLIGAGDIASCSSSAGDAQTAALLAQYPDAIVFTLGDNSQEGGSAAMYANCYGPKWGVHKARTRPTVGGHDLEIAPIGQAYLDYFREQLEPFGPTATDITKLYYSYDVGSWHVVVLTSECYFNRLPGCDPTQMEQWFAQDLAASSAECTIAMWHEPRWSSGAIHGNTTYVQPLWSIAYEAGVDIVLNGHEHDYERFAPQDANGQVDPAFGVREFVVGTGGYFFYDLGVRKPNSEVWSNANYGVLKLVLHDGSYDWEFVPVAGGTFTDSGTDSCHGKPPAPADGPQVKATTSGFVNAPATSITLARPAGTVAGDLLLAVLSHQGGTARTLVPPEGWTAVPNGDISDGSNARIRAWYKVAGPSEPTLYTFTSATNTYAIAGGVMTIGGANTAAPIIAAAGQAYPTNTLLLRAPSVTATSPNALLVYSAAVNVPLTITPPQGMTEQWDVQTNTQYNVTNEIATRVVPNVGPTDTSLGFPAQSARGVALHIAIAASASS